MTDPLLRGIHEAEQAFESYWEVEGHSTRIVKQSGGGWSVTVFAEMGEHERDGERVQRRITTELDSDGALDHGYRTVRPPKLVS